MTAVTFTDMTARLAAAGVEVRDTREAWDTARERRDALVVEAADQGMPQRAIAKATGLSQPRIVALIIERTGFKLSAAG